MGGKGRAHRVQSKGCSHFALLFLSAFAAMEGIAYLMHKYLMHGALWVLHESHHRPRQGVFERNDLFGVFFALPSIVLIYLGRTASRCCSRLAAA